MSQWKKTYLSNLPPQEHAPSPSKLNAVHCWLTYKEHNESSLDSRMETHSPEDNTLASCLPSIAEDDDDTEEHFLTVSLDDDFWREEPVP